MVREPSLTLVTWGNDLFWLSVNYICIGFVGGVIPEWGPRRDLQGWEDICSVGVGWEEIYRGRIG